MSLPEVMRTIESQEFIACLNVASGMRTFIAAAMQEDVIGQLLELLDTQAAQEKIFQKIVQLSRQRIDSRYENPSDTALAVYLWALSVKGSYLTMMAAGAAVEAQHCWWAEKLANRIIAGEVVSSENYTQVVEPQTWALRFEAPHDTHATFRAPFFIPFMAEHASVQLVSGRDIEITNPNSGSYPEKKAA